MILIKITVTILVVTGLSIIAERVSPRAAGILSGYPLGTAITLFFIGLEQGAAYAGESAVYAVAGMLPLMCFFYAYYLVSSRVREQAILAASAAAMVVLLAIDYFLQMVDLTPATSLLIAVASITGFRWVFKKIPNTRIAERLRLGLKVLLFRASLAALVIVVVTGAARLVPPEWAGLFSAFPSTVFPLVLIIHHTYGAEQAHTIIKNFPTGLWALVLYCVTISFAYPALGIYWGTLVGYAVATVYLLTFAAVQRVWHAKPNTDIIKLNFNK
jgi:hypothetical protein